MKELSYLLWGLVRGEDLRADTTLNLLAVVARHALFDRVLSGSGPSMAVSATSEDDPLTVLVSSRAIITLPDDTLTLTPATISVSPRTGKIVSVVPEILLQASFPPSTHYVDHSPKLLIPGLVDAHVHLNEPGRTEWEGFWTGTRAAASGGVTTVVDMPLNAIPPTTTLRGFKEKLEASRGKCWVDVGFYGGVIPGNSEELLPLVEAGVRGFKGFLIESGVSLQPENSGERMRQVKFADFQLG